MATNSRSKPDIGLTADRVSAHQILAKADKAARRVLNRGLSTCLEFKILPQFANRETFMASDAEILLHDQFPTVDRQIINSALAHMAKRPDGPVRRVGHMKSGVYTLRAKANPAITPPQPSADDLIQTILTALSALGDLVNRANKIEARLKEIGVTVSID